MSKKTPLLMATHARIEAQVKNMERDAYAWKWRKDVEKFDKEQEMKDKEQAKKDQVAQANKAIKDRRGMK